MHKKAIIGAAAILGGLVAIWQLNIFAVAGNLYATVIESQNENYQSCLRQVAQQYSSWEQSIEWEYQTANIDSVGPVDYIFTSTGASACGNNGCIYELCLVTNESADLLPFGYAAESIEILPTKTEGLKDIQLHGQSITTLSFEGTGYRLK